MTKKQFKRDDKGRFPKGVSGNPEGRPGVPAEVRELLGKHGIDALKTIIQLMYKSSDEKIRMTCAKDIADRAYGKAPQEGILDVKLGGDGVFQVFIGEKRVGE